MQAKMLAWVPRPILVDNKELEERVASWRRTVDVRRVSSKVK
jgi:hypothetical protein